MTFSTSEQNIQPRGTNGHKPGEFAEHTHTPLPDGWELQTAGQNAVHAAHILPGDTIFDDAGDQVGVALTVGPHPMVVDRIRVRLADGGAFSTDPVDIIRVTRDTVAPAYDTAADYRQKLAVAYHAATTEETLDLILDGEAEDDFMHAVASHRNANPIQVDRASRHHSFVVRQAAIDNPNTGISTLRRLGSEASAERRRTEKQIREEGTNPGTGSLTWQVEQNAKLEADAREALALRSHH